MNLTNTNICTAENGPRLAGRPDQCFYCRSGVGFEHEADCVLRKKTVVVKVEVQLLLEVPQSWSKGDAEFYLNESSSCSNNTIDRIVDQLERMMQQDHCACNWVKCEMVRDADVSDHQRFDYNADEQPGAGEE